MIYRIDYIMAVFVAGATAGAIVRRRFLSVAPDRIARVFYSLMCLRVVIGAVLFVLGIVLDNQPLFGRMGSGIADAASFVSAGLFGLALVRTPRLQILQQPLVYEGLCLSAAYAFLTAGFIKAFYLSGMLDFFTQSGYSPAFLKLIISLEVLGGAGLLIPWATLPMAFALSVDMFGAIWTHIHNGDPINDSTGAVGMLIRLGMIAAVWSLQPSTEDDRVIGRRFAASAIAAGLGMLVAVVGAAIARH